jgi:hypothetical protein
MTYRSITLDDGTVLNRYYDKFNTRPRPEAYVEDMETASKTNDTNIYVHLRAANILPVDLNCLLYHLELTLGKQSEAQRRREAIHKYMWSNDLEFFTDYNFIQKKLTNRLTLAGVYPLWLNVSTSDQSKNVARQIESLFLRDGGVITTISNQSTQHRRADGMVRYGNWHTKNFGSGPPPIISSHSCAALEQLPKFFNLFLKKKPQGNISFFVSFCRDCSGVYKLLFISLRRRSLLI